MVQLIEKDIICPTNGGVIEGAPEWCSKHLDELDFEWSPEEELEIERYCEKIHRNLAEAGEDMTPIERWKAHMAGKPADRKFINICTMTVYTTHSLDSFGDMLVPSDLYKYPKLMLKAWLATVARHKLDSPTQNINCYSEGIFGGRAKFIPFGNPCMVGEPPIKTMEDLERMKVPDPYVDGLYPGWLWANRELRRIIDKYELPMPLWSSPGPEANGTALLGMLGMSGFLINLRKNPELVRACCDLAQEWCKRLGKALLDVCRPDGIYYCQFTGLFPLKGNEWIADHNAELAKYLKGIDPNCHLSHGYSLLSGIYEWYEVMYGRGALGLDAFDGGTSGELLGADGQRIINWHREHELFLTLGIDNVTLEAGPISAIEEQCKLLCDMGKDHRKFAPGSVPNWWTPQAHIDAVVDIYKKNCKL